ncbi:hypothetical protein GCM10023148_14470 [Actinokineospora soli]
MTTFLKHRGLPLMGVSLTSFEKGSGDQRCGRRCADVYAAWGPGTPDGMTALPPDPDPDRTPGLEPGGGVRPGDTPPDSGSTTRGLARPEPGTRRSRAGAFITLGAVLVLVLMVVGLLVAQLVGWIKVF